MAWSAAQRRALVDAGGSILLIGGVAPHRLSLAIGPGTTLCIDRLEVVTLRSLS